MITPAATSENAPAANGIVVQLVCDAVGKQIILPYANPENFVLGVSATMNGTAVTSLIVSPGGNLRNYVTAISITNSHPSVGTVVNIRDGSAGATIYSAFCGTAGIAPILLSFPTPLRQPTVGTALNCLNVSTGASVIVSASGYKGV